MKKIYSEKGICYIFNVLAVIMFTILFYYCLRLTGENSGEIWDEHIYFKRDSILLNGIFIFISVICLYFIGKLSPKFQSKKRRNILLAVACVLSALFSVYWVFASKTKPIADQSMICQYANAFNMGDFHGFSTGQYLARYSQQLGMVTLLKGLFSVFGESNYFAFQYLCAGLVPLLVLSGCMIVRILTDDNARAELYYLLFILSCFPMYAYTAFVYGDLIAIIFGIFGIWMFLSCIKRFSWVRLVLFSLSIGIGVMLRKNLLILVIALGIVLVVKMVFNRSYRFLVMLAALAAGVGGMHLALWGMYADVRTEDGPAIPASLYIVMGLNDDHGYAGWHNTYEYATFAKLDDNVELANQEAFAVLRMYLEIYKNDPGYMLDFFVRKMNSQWNAPMYQSIAMNIEVEGEQLQPVKNIYEGGVWAKWIEFQMKIYQLLLYGSILFLLTARRKNFVSIERYVLLIAVFGGFLFSLIWEAKTRYVMPYLFMQIPYMAMGINELMLFLEEKKKIKNEKAE